MKSYWNWYVKSQDFQVANCRGYMWNRLFLKYQEGVQNGKEKEKASKVFETEFSMWPPESFYGIPPCQDVLVIKQNAWFLVHSFTLFHLPFSHNRERHKAKSPCPNHFFKQILNPEVTVMTYFYPFGHSFIHSTYFH